MTIREYEKLCKCIYSHKELSDSRDESLMLYHKSKVDHEAYIAFKSVNAGLEKQFA